MHFTLEGGSIAIRASGFSVFRLHTSSSPSSGLSGQFEAVTNTELPGENAASSIRVCSVGIAKSATILSACTFHSRTLPFAQQTSNCRRLVHTLQVQVKKAHKFFGLWFPGQSHHFRITCDVALPRHLRIRRPNTAAMLREFALHHPILAVPYNAVTAA